LIVLESLLGSPLGQEGDGIKIFRVLLQGAAHATFNNQGILHDGLKSLHEFLTLFRQGLEFEGDRYHLGTLIESWIDASMKLKFYAKRQDAAKWLELEIELA
jgi:hypothetical protein